MQACVIRSACANVGAARLLPVVAHVTRIADLPKLGLLNPFDCLQVCVSRRVHAPDGTARFCPVQRPWLHQLLHVSDHTRGRFHRPQASVGLLLSFHLFFPFLANDKRRGNPQGMRYSESRKGAEATFSSLSVCAVFWITAAESILDHEDLQICT